MRSFGLASALTAATALFAGGALAQGSTQVDPIVIKGSKFFYKTNGTEFFIKGVAYQQDYSGNGTTSNAGQGYTDPLADPSKCQRDIPYISDLGMNVIRVYAIDPTKNHDECMNALAQRGIYVVADLSAPVEGLAINRDSPDWDDELYARYASVIDALADYSNTLGFFAGNEVSNMPNNTNAAPFVKAAVRDMKAYISKQGYRPMGVGYATDDNQYVRENIVDYFNCGDQSDAIDFWGYNIYSWCGDSTYQESGYADRTQEFESFSVPAFFAEYGCNTQGTRTFQEVGALYGPQMSKVFSGGIVYMYFQEENDYGLVNVNGDSVSKLPDYSNLQSQLAKVSPSGVQMDSYNPTNSPASCPTVQTNWSAMATPLPPTPNKELCACMYSSLACVVSPRTNEDDYSDLFGTVCGLDKKACAGINHNGTTGDYGAYGMCNSTEQLGFAFNQYYSNNGKQASNCDFDGAARTQSVNDVGDTCSSLMQQAGRAGTGTVTAQPSGTGAGAGGSGGNGNGGAAGSSSQMASPRSTVSVQVGLLPVLGMLAVAVFSGVGMILL